MKSDLLVINKISISAPLRWRFAPVMDHDAKNARQETVRVSNPENGRRASMKSSPSSNIRACWGPMRFAFRQFGGHRRLDGFHFLVKWPYAIAGVDFSRMSTFLDHFAARGGCSEVVGEPDDRRAWRLLDLRLVRWSTRAHPPAQTVRREIDVMDWSIARSLDWWQRRSCCWPRSRFR